MNPKEELRERINNEITSIMEEQTHLGAEKENYRHNENAVKTYAEMLNSFDEGDRKDRELELKSLNEKRLSEELELKIKNYSTELEMKRLEEERLTKAFETETRLKERELELKSLEEERLTKELELRARELNIELNNRMISEIIDIAKYFAGMLGFKKIFEMILAYEKEGVISTKTFNPIMGTAFRFLLPK